MGYYRRKPEIVDAKIYEPGDEDGFSANLLDYDCMTMEQLEAAGYVWDEVKIPYVETENGRIGVHEGDYIIWDGIGAVAVYHPEEFKEKFEYCEGW